MIGRRETRKAVGKKLRGGATYRATSPRAPPHPSCGSWCKPICRHWKKPAALNSPRKKVGSTADTWPRWGSAARRSLMPAEHSRTLRTTPVIVNRFTMALTWAPTSPADLLTDSAHGAGAVALGWSGYGGSLRKAVGLVLPAGFVPPRLAFDAATHAWTLTGAVLDLPAATVIILITAILVAGVRETARFNGFLVAVKLVGIVLFVASTGSAFSPANWIAPANPQGAFIPPHAGPGGYGWWGLGPGADV